MAGQRGSEATPHLCALESDSSELSSSLSEVNEKPSEHSLSSS